ncbi:MFS transporter [Sinisalibacter lacisalsi]|uniref:MFS transporter n=1 Tax=Sinisalibacter lacisalsi TaxID=1526570 RepID=A0ABQ1QKK2_9RHOB|nr:MFS transporter [Sinisalibacter lacisalsi]GGD31241.1 MFS transporter [Sinisalibacter lacisalsi]
MAMKQMFSVVTGADADDIRPGEARNGVIHVAALTLTKTADALIDPKLVLSWLLTALGAPGAIIGALVPVREAGALLPQLALARRVEASPQRKRFWAVGSAVQGLAALGIAAAALLFEGALAGGLILASLAVLAVARSAASVSYKDALARTIAKRRRGAITGLAASVASVSVFGVGLLMATGIFEIAVAPLAAIIAIAGAAFLFASAIFIALREPRNGAATGNDDGSFAALVAPLWTDAQLRLFVAARAALAVTALAPPFIVMLSTASGRTALDELGPLVMASTAASVLASYIWGRFSDRSSRQTLMAAGGLGAAAFAVIGGLGLAFDGLGGALGAAAAIFAAQIAYEGVRAGRKLHLTDMAEDSFRARYTALSNTLIGAALLAGGLFGLAADLFGPAPVLLAFAVIAALGAGLARGLDEVQAE